MSEQTTQQLWLRLSESDIERVDQIAQKENRTRAAQLKAFVEQALSAYAPPDSKDDKKRAGQKVKTA